MNDVYPNDKDYNTNKKISVFIVVADPIPDIFSNKKIA